MAATTKVDSHRFLKPWVSEAQVVSHNRAGTAANQEAAVQEDSTPRVASRVIKEVVMIVEASEAATTAEEEAASAATEASKAAWEVEEEDSTKEDPWVAKDSIPEEEEEAITRTKRCQASEETTRVTDKDSKAKEAAEGATVDLVITWGKKVLTSVETI